MNFFGREKERYIFKLVIDQENQKKIPNFFCENPDYFDEKRLQEIASAGKRVYRLDFFEMNVELKGETLITDKGIFPGYLKEKDRKKAETLMAKKPNRVCLQVSGGDYKLFLCDHDYKKQYYPINDRTEKFRGFLIIEP